MENKIESRTDKIEVQPKERHDDEFLGDLNDAMAKKIGQATDQDNSNSPIDPEDIAGAAGVQRLSDVLLNDQEYEQLYSQVQQQIDDMLSKLTDIQSDLAGLLIHDVFYTVANNEEIHTGVLGTQAGITVDNYNAVTAAISELKRMHKSAKPVL